MKRGGRRYQSSRTCIFHWGGHQSDSMIGRFLPRKTIEQLNSDTLANSPTFAPHWTIIIINTIQKNDITQRDNNGHGRKRKQMLATKRPVVGPYRWSNGGWKEFYCSTIGKTRSLPLGIVRCRRRRQRAKTVARVLGLCQPRSRTSRGEYSKGSGAYHRNFDRSSTPSRAERPCRWLVKRCHLVSSPSRRTASSSSQIANLHSSRDGTPRSNLPTSHGKE